MAKKKRTLSRSVPPQAMTTPPSAMIPSTVPEVGGGRTRIIAAPLFRVLLLALAVFIFAVPYFQGLYFEKQRLRAEIIVFAMMIVCLGAFLRRRSKVIPAFPRGYLGLASLLVPVAYVLAIPLAASGRSALGEALTAILLLGVMWLVSEVVSSERDLDLILTSIVASGVRIAAIGMATATKVFVYPSAFEGGRLSSTLQYPNTAASALMASYFAAATMWVKASTSTSVSSPTSSVQDMGRPVALLESLAWGMASSLIFTGFILTQSRGAWVVLPLVALAFAAGLAWRARIAFFLYLGTGLVSGITASTRFVAALGTPDPSRAWTQVVSVCGLSAVVLALSAFLLRVACSLASRGISVCPMKTSRTLRLALAVVIAASALGVISAGVVLVQRGFDTGPLARLKSVSLSDSSARERILWTLDAVRIALHHPLTGVGGGGWALVYHRYKAYPYYSKLVHNHFAQVLVDTGFIGLVAFLLFCFCLVRTAWTSLHHEDAKEGLKTTVWGAGSAAAALGLHGALDFNLSLPAIAVFLWALAAIVYRGGQLATAGEAERPGKSEERRGCGWSWVSAIETAITGAAGCRVVLGVFFVALLLASSLAVSGQYVVGGTKAWSQRQYETAISLMNRAAAFDPWNSAIRAELGRYYEQLGETKRDRDLLRKSLENFASAVRLNPYDSSTRLHYAAILFNTGQPTLAIQNAQESITNNRFLVESYEVLTALHVESAKRLALAGSLDEARKAFSQGLEVIKLMEQTNAGVPEHLRKFCVQQAPQMEPSPVMRLYRAQALFFLGDRDAALTELKVPLGVPDQRIEKRALLWVGLVEISRGDEVNGSPKVREAFKSIPELAKEASQAKEITQKLGLGYKL